MKRLSLFFRGAGLLAVCALVAKAIGAFYRIPLTNILGSEGIGLYQMVFPLYTVLLTISSGGLPVAIAKTVAVKSEGEARNAARAAIVALSISGLFAALVIALLNNVISKLQGNSAASLAYLGIAPSILFVAVISCFRGFFQGRHNMLPTSISQLVEQIIKLAFGLWFAYLLMPYGAVYGVLGSVLGVSLSEAVAMIILILQYHIYVKRNPIMANTANSTPQNNSNANDDDSVQSINLNVETAEELAAFSSTAAIDNTIAVSVDKTANKLKRKQLLKEIYKTAVPVTLGSLVLPLTQVIDSFLVINLLTRFNFTSVMATSLYGLVTGPVNSLINMPTVITLSFAGVLLPRVSAAHAKGLPLDKTINKTLKTSLVLGGALSLGLLIFAPLAMKILYSSGLSKSELNLSSALLRIGAIGVFYVSVIQVATSVLQGTDKAHLPAINLLIGASLKVVLNFILLPIFGIVGAVISTAACYALTCMLDVIAMKKVL